MNTPHALASAAPTPLAGGASPPTPTPVGGAAASVSASTSASASGALPPKPPAVLSPWFGLGHLADMRADLLATLRAWQRCHGDVFRLRLMHEEAVVLFTPELVRELLVDHAGQLIRWERAVSVFAEVFGQGVLTTEGATWQRQRRMLQPAFTPRRVAGYARLMTAATHDALAQAVPDGQPEAEVDMDALFARVAMDVILRTLFGQPVSGEAQAAIHATRVLSETAVREMFYPLTLPDWLPLPGKAAKRQAVRSLRGLIAGHIQRRQAQPNPTASDDLLAMLLSLRDEDSGAGLSPAELFDQCLVSFQAGHETSATALLWWSHLLATHPEAAQRAQAEVDAVLAGRTPSADDAHQLPWLTATLKEALRLYPPIALLMTRRATAELSLGGGRWRIPRGAMIYLAPWVMQRDPRWFEAPEAFRPERFLPGAPAIERGAWMPFGAGPRVCIGQHFAMLEMTLVAAMLLQRYALHPLAGAAPPEPVLNVTLRPRNGLVLRLRRR